MEKPVEFKLVRWGSFRRSFILSFDEVVALFDNSGVFFEQPLDYYDGFPASWCLSESNYSPLDAALHVQRGATAYGTELYNVRAMYPLFSVRWFRSMRGVA